jgi:hypothetical protein
MSTRAQLRLASQRLLHLVSVVTTVLLCMAQCITLHILSRNTKSLVVINYEDRFVADRASQFDLPRVIQQYDQVINELDRYYYAHGAYPDALSTLVPEYLPEMPGIYIRKGERLTYTPVPLAESNPPFTFYIYGHYPGLAFMHGWMLYYCPDVYSGCNAPGDRHFHPHRVNYRWIWISRSAL